MSETIRCDSEHMLGMRLTRAHIGTWCAMENSETASYFRFQSHHVVVTIIAHVLFHLHGKAHAASQDDTQPISIENGTQETE